MKIHFIGIGGIGVSALARYYLSKGHKISGSDLVSSEITEALKIKCKHKSFPDITHINFLFSYIFYQNIVMNVLQLHLTYKVFPINVNPL